MPTTPSTDVDIVIVGAGAAGLMAGIWAGRTATGCGRSLRIVLLEGAAKLGRKILISGGGRCNVTNRVVAAEDFAGGSVNAIRKVLKRFDVAETLAFFDELGVHFKTEEETGKLFPTTDRARTVLDALLGEAGRYAEIRYPCRVESIAQVGPGNFRLAGPWGALTAGSLVLATGGKSVPNLNRRDTTPAPPFWTAVNIRGGRFDVVVDIVRVSDLGPNPVDYRILRSFRAALPTVGR